MSAPCLPRRARSALGALGAAASATVLVASCSAGTKAAAPTTTATTAAPTPSEVLASCSPAVGSDFVDIERAHLVHGAHHLGQGFVSAETPQGHYLAANLYDIDDVQLATGLVWRINPDGTAMSAIPADDQWDALPDVPAAQNVPHPELIACAKAALAAG